MAITHVDDIWHFFFKFSWILKGPYNVSPAKNFVYSLKQFVNIGHERSDWNNSQKVKECHKWLLNGEGSLGCHTYCDTRISFILFISEYSWHLHLVSLPVSTLYDLGLLRLGLHTVVKLTSISKSPKPLIYEGCPMCDMHCMIPQKSNMNKRGLKYKISIFEMHHGTLI